MNHVQGRAAHGGRHRKIMSTSNAIRVVRPIDKVRTMEAAGDNYRFLATGNDTDGQYFLVEAIVPPGGGPPSHIQTREEEAFYILDGQITFYSDDGEINAGPGTYLNIPKGAKHRFRNNTDDTAKMLFFFSPAGIEGMFDQFENIDVSDPKNMLTLKELGERFGVEYLPE